MDALQSTLDQLRAIQEQITGFIAQLHQRQAEFEQAYKTATARSLTARERLPASREGWARLGAELRALPHTAVGMARTVVGDLRAAWAGADLERRLLLVALELGWLALLGALARIPAQRGVPLRPDVSFSAKTRIVILALLKRLPWTLLPAGALLLAAYVLRLPAKDLELLTVLALVAVGLQLVVGLSRWLFVSDLVSEERRDRGLYRRIVGVASVMAVLLVLADLGHLGYISRTLWGLVERAFMGLQLPLVPVALRLRGRLMEELEQTWGMTFWTRMLGLVSLSVPITIVATGLVGLSGYINLAWFITGKLVLLLGILLVWAALRHLFMDWTEHLRERAQRYPKRAPLIVTGVIDPLEFTGRLGLFFAAVYAAGSALRWSTGTGVGAVLRDWLTRPLFHLGSAQVNALHLVGALVYITVLVYFGLWVRRLAR
ncbi:MAG TPA: hypothetical protein ENK62_08650, partial [Chromatiales bacterium]|nr:hypothetical protein [Chromatiales bacterium]